MTATMNVDTIRLLMSTCLLAMFILAIFYLRRRPLTWYQFAVWGLFALLVPGLGPFLVILARPGQTRPRAEVVRARRRR